MNEKELSFKYAEVLSTYFHIVLDKVFCDCGKCRFDMLLTCKETGAKFIVEMKKEDNIKGDAMAKHFDQAMNYRLHKIKGICYPVLMAPAYSNRVMRAVKSYHPKDQNYSIDFHGDDHLHHRFNGFVGHFGVGEIRLRSFKPIPYRRFMFKNQELYSCNPNEYGNKGLHKTNYITLLKRLNKWPLSLTSKTLRVLNPIICQPRKPSTVSEPEQLSTLLTNLGQ